MQILLKEWMQRKQLSYRQVERMSGLKKSTLWKISNKAKSPTMDEMEALARGLRVPIHNLYESEVK